MGSNTNSEPKTVVAPGSADEPVGERGAGLLQSSERGDRARGPSGLALPPIALLALLGLVLGLLGILYWPFIQACVAAWRSESSYYSHGFLVPVIAAWLLWVQRGQLAAIAPRPSNWGFVLVFASLAFHVFANYVYMQTGVGLAVVLMLMGLVLIFHGRPMLRRTAFPIAFLLFAVPMSPIFTEPISFPMRLISTRLAVSMLHVVGVPSRATGTLMQFPGYALVVPNACSGMQSLLALFAALTMFVYVVRGVWWKKAILLAAIPPLVIFANAVRLSLTGLAAGALSQRAAEGTVHELTGILVFVIALLALLFIAKNLLGLNTLAIDAEASEAPEEG
jgi:exosortase